MKIKKAHLREGSRRAFFKFSVVHALPKYGTLGGNRTRTPEGTGF